MRDRKRAHSEAGVRPTSKRLASINESPRAARSRRRAADDDTDDKSANKSPSTGRRSTSDKKSNSCKLKNSNQSKSKSSIVNKHVAREASCSDSDESEKGSKSDTSLRVKSPRKCRSSGNSNVSTKKYENDALKKKSDRNTGKKEVLENGNTSPTSAPDTKIKGSLKKLTKNSLKSPDKVTDKDKCKSSPTKPRRLSRRQSGKSSFTDDESSEESIVPAKKTKRSDEAEKVDETCSVEENSSTNHDDASSDEVIIMSEKKKAKTKVVDITESSDEDLFEEISSDDSKEEVQFDSDEEYYEELHKHISSLQKELKKTKEKYQKQIEEKDDEIARLRNDLKWKDEQLEERNDLVSKNMELEAKISAMIGDKDVYEKEVKQVQEQKEESKKTKNKDNEPKIKEDESKDTKPKSDTGPQSTGKTKSEGKGKNKSRPAKGKRRSRRGKKADESEDDEGDIDTLFVDDGEESDDIEVIESPSKSVKKKPAAQDESSDSKKQPDQKTDAQEKAEKSGADGEKEDEEEDESKTGRHNIRKLMTGKKLTEQTKAAAKAEKERVERVKRSQEQHLIIQEDDPKSKMKICTKLALALKEGTKTPMVEVLPKLVKKLKPHQVEAVEFMWDNLVESLEKLKKKDPGQGCILAHCMGLGKTLSVISLVHTLLKSKPVGFKHCMVVCPLNTVLNWQYEWKKWFDKKDRITTYELASCKGHHERAQLLSKWHKSGGIMILGYSLFRILANYTGKSKKCKKAYDEALLEPGPDIVVCDEGHVLKNDASALSKAMSRIQTRRRIVLTGTPLQNNLIEYHCMTDFVKPNLLGTRREFSNRFANPITNGQHSDSTPRDVKLMKRRAHVLHEMLHGCVQRRDYSALTKFLPPKHEYVISVRLSPLQIELYDKYLETFRSEEKQAASQMEGRFKIRGASLFTDYQALMRVWTHPWVLKLDALRQEKKALNEQDDELDSLDDDEEEIVMSDSEEEETTEVEADSEEEEEESSSESSDASVPPPPPRTRRTRNAQQQPQTDAKQSQSDKDKAAKKDKRKVKTISKEEKQSASSEGEKDTDGEANKSEDDKKGDAKVLGGEVIRTWKSTSRHGKQEGLSTEDLVKKDTQWWSALVDEDKHHYMLDLSGKLILLFEILRMSEGLGDKVLLFSQSILTLDLIEEFLKHKNEEAEKWKGKKANKPSSWIKDEDYLRMDGSTGAQNRSKFTNDFNEIKNKRLRLFLISTRAGGLGINLDSANRVIIFDASWNPSHDVQSIFRAYRFGQEKAVYVYRLLAQGTMEEKIYERQVTKETLSQRVIDEHQIDRHFTASDLKELYVFKPDRLDDPDRKEPPTPKMPEDVILTELLARQKAWIYGYHEHDSLLENRPDENLSEEEKKAAWEEYDRDKQGLYSHYTAAAPTAHRTPLFTSYLTGPRPQLGVPNVGAMAQFNRMVTPMPQPAFPSRNVHLAQLPRVVQEILKYNPTITAEELQSRLQSFMGMHSRYTNASGHSQVSVKKIQKEDGKPAFRVSVKPPQGPAPPLPVSISVTQPLPIRPAAGPSTSGPAPLLTAVNFPNPMPSRLPLPGNLPASKKSA